MPTAASDRRVSSSSNWATRAPATRPIFVEKEGWRGGPFARQLAKPPLRDLLGDLGIEPNGAQIRQPGEDSHEV